MTILSNVLNTGDTHEAINIRITEEKCSALICWNFISNWNGTIGDNLTTKHD